MSLFKPYAHFNPDDFSSLLQDIKLHKIKRNTRMCNFGENADRVYLVMNGRIAITYPTAAYFKMIQEGGIKLLKSRTQ